jgi:hypothetical protein
VYLLSDQFQARFQPQTKGAGGGQKPNGWSQKATTVLSLSPFIILQFKKPDQN